MPLQKAPVQVTFGPADQKTQSKQLQAGRPSVAENVVQTKTGSYRKRGGFDDTSRSADSGSITTGKDLVLSGATPVLRTADTVYARPSSTWISRGAYIPAAPAYEPIAYNLGARPLMVVVGTQTWTFVQSSDFTWNYHVSDNGIEVVPPTKISFTPFLRARAVTTASRVWLFAGATAPHGTNNTIKLFQFNTSTPATAPTSTTFASPTGVSVDAWDVIDAGVNGIVMAIGSSDAGGLNFGAGAAALFCGRLNTATGLVDATGWVAATGVALGVFGNPMSWVRVGQSATLLHFLWRRPSNSHIFLTTVTASSLASTSADTTAQLASAKGGISAYRETATGNVVFFLANNFIPTPGIENSTVSRFSWDGASLTGLTDNFARARSITSDPFFIGSTPYIVLQHDDTQTLQNAYYVMDASAAPGRIIARTLYQLGSNIWQRGFALNSDDRWDNNWICPVTVSGFRASLAVGSFSSSTLTTMKVTVDFAPTDLSQPVTSADGALTVFPGGWPMALSGGGALTDLTPGMYPRGSWTVAAAGSGGTLPVGLYGCTVRYVVMDRQGNLQRSAPSPTQSVSIATAGQCIRFSNLPTLRVTNAVAKAFIEIYTTTANGSVLFLSSWVDNVTTSDVIATTDISYEPPTGSEIIDTDGGGLERISAPPFKWVATWRNRIFLGGTDSPIAEVWPSFELLPGQGPGWNELLRFRLADGTGKDTAGCAVDFNYFAIFKSDSVWLVSGAGPDPIGIGSYAGTLQQVPDAPGCVNPRSVVQTPLGCMYQARNGEIWLVSRGGTAHFLGDGWEDHTAATVTAAVHSPHHELVLFFTDSSRVLVWDYGNPLPEQGSLGQPYVWRLAAAPVAAAVSGSTVVWLDSTGVMHSYSASSFTDGASTAILRKLKLPINLTGIRGHQRLYRGQVVGQFANAHQLKVTWTTFAGAAGETGSTSQSWTRTVSGGPELFEFRPDAMKHAVAEVTLEDVGTDLVEGASWDGLALEVGVRPGLPRIGTGQRLT